MLQENASTKQPGGRFRQTRRACWLAIALASAVAGCSHTTPTSSLPPPPVPSDKTEAEIRQLTIREHLHLLLWLDEQERYFEGVECWLASSEKDPACSFGQ